MSDVKFMNNKSQNKFKIIFDILAIISMIGIVLCVIAVFSGAMLFCFLVFRSICLTLIVIYLISLIETIISICKTGIKNNKIKVISHSIIILGFILLGFKHFEVSKSKKVLEAYLVDDWVRYTLVFRENGCVENHIYMLGFTEEIKGNYILCLPVYIPIFIFITHTSDQ